VGYGTLVFPAWEWLIALWFALDMKEERRKVEDDDGHTLTRGQPMAVCEKTFRIYSSAPYSEEILPVPPLEAVAPESAPGFDCSRDTVRHPRETKGLEYRTTTNGSATCCGPDGCG